MRFRFSPDAPNEWAEAARLARRMIELAPQKPEGQRCLGMALLGLDQFDEAKAVFEKLIATEPTDEDSYFLLADALARRGKPQEEWRRYIDQAVANNASSWSVHLKAYQFFAAQGDADSAKKSLARALEVGGKEPEVLFAAAIAEEREGRLEPAREGFQKLREANPADPSSYVALARLKRRGGDVEGALSILRDGLLQVKNAKAEIAFQIADTLLDQGRLRDAEEQLDQLRSLAPGTPPLALLEGQQAIAEGKLYAARAQLERAGKGFELAVRASPPLAQARLVVGRRYAMLMESWRLLGKCYMLLGTCYGRLGEPGAARDTLAEALRFWPASVSARTALAQALLATGEFDAAAQQAELATKVADEQGRKDPDAWLTLASALRALSQSKRAAPGLLDKAIAAATKAAELRPRPDALILLAQLHLDAGKPSLAEGVLRRQVADPKDALQLQVARVTLFAASKPPDLAKAKQEHADAVQKHGDKIELRLLRPFLLGPGATFEAKEKCLLDVLGKASASDAPRIRAALATLYVSRVQPEKAIEQLKAIAQAEPGNAAVRNALLELAFEAGLDKLAPPVIEELARIEGESSPNVVCYQAEYDLTTAKPEAMFGVAGEVAGRLQKLLEQSPTWRAWALLGDARKLQGKLSEATNSYQAAFRANPRFVRTGLPLVRSLNESERYEEAAVVLDRLTSLDAQSPALLDLQLDQFRRRHDLEGAIQLMKNRLALQPQNAAILVTLGDMHLARRNFPEAEKHLRNALQSSPKNPGIVDRLVFLLKQTQREDEALKLCNEFIAAQPDKPVGYLSRSRHHRLSGRPEKAAEDLERALALVPPKDAAARKQILIGLGNVSLERGDTDAALDWHRKAAALEPPGSDARKFFVERLLRAGRQAHITEAESLVAALLKEAPNDPHAHLLNARIAALDPETFPLAKQHCARAIELAPKMAQPHSVLSTIHEAEGDLRRATEEASRAVSCEPDSFPTLLQYARLLRLQRQLTEARAILEKAIRLDPGDLRGLLAQAELARAEAGPDAAIALLKKALADSEAGGKTPASATLRLNLAWYLWKAGKDTEAEAELREACKLAANSLDTLSALARFLEERKRYDETDRLLDEAARTSSQANAAPVTLLRAEILLARRRGPTDLDAAERHARQALATQPGSSTAFRILADVAAARNDTKSAEGLYREALKHNSRNAQAANNLAWLLSKAGRHQEALPLARRAAGLEEGNPEFHGTLGEVFYQLGEFAQAERAFGRCIEIDTKNVRALSRLGLTLAKLGKRQAAKDALDRALQADGGTVKLTEDQRNEIRQALERLAQARQP
jgi:tetratricopeptide (TPR) repeat protein